MKRYRYDDPNKITRGQRFRAYTVLFILWNVAGYGVYKLLSNNAAKKDPEWENRPEDEKVAFIHGKDPTSLIKFSFFGSSEKEKNES